MGRLLVADGSSQIYRAFHALSRGAGQRLAAKDGTPTGALHAFLQILRKALRDHAPDMVAVSFDRRAKTFRHEMFPEYKAQRDAMPEELAVQLDLAREALAALRIPVVEADGFEADDVIATLVRRAVDAGHEVVVLTSDKDLLQLVGPRVKVHHALRDEVMDEPAATDYFGVPPSRVRDVLAIQGDASDNIPGVPGIGEKGARQLVQLYGDLETILASTPAIAGDERLGRLRKRLAQLLAEHGEQARLSHALVTLRDDVPLEEHLDALRQGEPDAEAASALFGRLGMEKLLADIGLAGSAGRPPLVDHAAAGARHALVATAAELEEVARDLRAAGRFALDTETDGPNPHAARLVGIGVACRPLEGRYVPVGHAAGPNVDMSAVRRILGPVLADASIGKVGQNAKFDMEVLARHDLPVEGLVFDTMLASYLLSSERRGHGLDSLAADHLGYRTITYAEVAGTGAAEVTLDCVDPARVATYCGEDAEVALRLAGCLGPLLATAGLEPLFRDIEVPLVPVLVDMELAGVLVDAQALGALSMELEKRLFELEHEIHRLAGHPFNIQSPKQLGDVLFEELGLEPRGRTAKTGARSTAVEVLEELASVHPLPGLVVEHRELSKLKGTYVDVLPRLVNATTGRVHTSYNQSVAATGRLSSSDPNLQNIPTRTELGRRVRKAFVAAPGCCLVGADYSQVELRIMAHISGDEALCEAFARGEDIHQRTASMVFHVLPELVTPEMRRRAKEVNFGVLYGMTAHGLAQRLGIPRREAQDVIDRYMGSFPRVRDAIQRILDEVRSSPKHEARTLFGRVRALPDIVSRNQGQRAFAERAAVNAVVQGTAADLIKLAMIALHRRLRRDEPSARLILQVHDELVVETPRERAGAVRAAVVEEMEGVMKLAAPLEAVAGTGDTWYDLA